MADFFYRAVLRDGTINEGHVTASTIDLASKELRSQGLTPLKLEASKQKQTKKTSLSTQGLKSTDVLAFTAELSVLLKAGLPLERSLKIMIDMSANDDVLALLNTLWAKVKSGEGFSRALEEYEGLFGVFYISMIRSGEASGNLAEVLAHLADYLENAKEIKNNVVSALIYPAILLVVAGLSIIVMLGWVVPQFESLFNDMGDALPGLTRGVLNAGAAIKAYGLVAVVMLAVLFFSVQRWFSTDVGKKWLDKQLLKLPLLGAIIFKFELGKFSRAMGTLLANGVPLLQALSIAVDTVTNYKIKQVLDRLIPEVKAGRRISVVLEEAKSFSPMVIQIIKVGEESGKLDSMMMELAKVHDGEVKTAVNRSLSLLEPILILAMGGSIAFIMIAIILGILSVNDLAL